MLANSYQVAEFKRWVAARDKAVKETTYNNYQASIDNFKAKYTNVAVFDTNKGFNGVAKAETNNNYIEIQNGGITFRKQGDKLTISLKETFEYTDANLLKFNTTLSAGLEVIAAASKFDPPKTVSGVDI